MRAKRKALHYKGAKSAKPIALPTPPQELSEGFKPKDFARLENEGGVNGKISGKVEQPGPEISHPFL